MQDSHGAAGLAIVSAAVTPQLFALFLPGLHELPTLSPAQVSGLRRGELYGAILALALGAGSSLIARSPWPVLVAAAMTAGLIHVYETAVPEGVR